MTTEIEHTFNNDLEIFLISPAGTEVTLSTDNGRGADNVFDGTFNVPEGHIVPENAMAAFTGLEGGGTWKLIVADDTLGNIGTFGFWALRNDSYSCAADLTVAQSRNI